MIEVQVINYLLKSKDTNFIQSISKEYFHNFRDEFVYIRNHYDRYNSIPDEETFLNVFNDFELFDVTEPKSYLLDELCRCHANTSLAETFNKVRPLLIEGKTEEAIKVLKNTENISLENITLNDMFSEEELNKSMDFVLTEKKEYPKTGISELDDINVLGGICEDDFGIIYGRSGNGKSWVSEKIALGQYMNGSRVGYYSSEMTKEEVKLRFHTLRKGFPNGLLKCSNGNTTYENEGKTKNLWTEFERWCEYCKDHKKDSCLIVFDNTDLNNEVLSVNRVEEIMIKYDLDILFIDQVHHMKGYGKTEWEKVGNIVDGLLKVKIKLNKAIVGVVQQNRTSSETDNKDTTQIAGSDKVGQNATWVLNVAQEPKDAGLKEKIVYLELVKNRRGISGGKYPYLINFSTGKFESKPDALKKEDKEEDDEPFK